MAINDPEARAARITTKDAARRLYDAIDAERDDRQLDADWLAAADRAQADLEQRLLSQDMSPEPTPTTSGDDEDGTTPPERPKSSGARAGGGGAGGRRGGRRAQTARAGRRARTTGRRVSGVLGNIPGVSAGGSIATALLWGTLGLVLLWVLLRASQVLRQGTSPIDLFASGLSKGLSVLIAPIDPLAPRATRQQAAVANAADVRQVLVDGIPLNAATSPVRRPALTTR